MAVDGSNKQDIEALAPSMAEARERDAVAAYFAFLLKRGATTIQLKQRATVLVQLDASLHGISADGLAYREAVEQLLAEMPRDQWPYCLAVVREFFLFWTQNFKLIARFSAEEQFDLEMTQWRALDGDLKTVWTKLDKDPLNETDTRLLTAYGKALQKNPQVQGAVETRIKLAKLLLVRLGGTPNRTPRIYRKGVDATVPVFEMREMRFLFLDVVRELFYFWVGDPEAENYVLRTRPAGNLIEI